MVRWICVGYLNVYLNVLRTRFIFKESTSYFLLVKLRVFIYKIISFIIFLKECYLLRKLWICTKMFLMMCLHIRTSLIWFWLMWNGSPFACELFWSRTRLFDLYCFSIYRRLQDLIHYSSLHLRNRSFRVLSLLFVSLSCIVLMHV